MTETLTGVTVMLRFDVLPENGERWQQVWDDVGRMALGTPSSGCRAFRLAGETNSSGKRVVVSEWESRKAFNAFVRSKNLLWLSRGLEYSTRPAEVTYHEHTAAIST